MSTQFETSQRETDAGASVNQWAGEYSLMGYAQSHLAKGTELYVYIPKYVQKKIIPRNKKLEKV